MVLGSFSFNGSKIYRGFNPAINDPVTNRASALSLVSYLTKKKASSAWSYPDGVSYRYGHPH